MSWKIQFPNLLIGYDHMGSINGTRPCPPTTINENNIEIVNPQYSF